MVFKKKLLIASADQTFGCGIGVEIAQEGARCITVACCRGVDEADAAILEKYLHLPGNLFRPPPVVLIQEGNELAPRACDRCVSGGRHAPVFLADSNNSLAVRT